MTRRVFIWTYDDIAVAWDIDESQVGKACELMVEGIRAWYSTDGEKFDEDYESEYFTPDDAEWCYCDTPTENILYLFEKCGIRATNFEGYSDEEFDELDTSDWIDAEM